MMKVNENQIVIEDAAKGFFPQFGEVMVIPPTDEKSRFVVRVCHEFDDSMYKQKTVKVLPEGQRLVQFVMSMVTMDWKTKKVLSVNDDSQYQQNLTNLETWFQDHGEEKGWMKKDGKRIAFERPTEKGIKTITLSKNGVKVVKTQLRETVDSESLTKLVNSI